jgi:hypothetical protein
MITKNLVEALYVSNFEIDSSKQGLVFATFGLDSGGEEAVSGSIVAECVKSVDLTTTTNVSKIKIYDKDEEGSIPSTNIVKSLPMVFKTYNVSVIGNPIYTYTFSGKGLSSPYSDFYIQLASSNGTIDGLEIGKTYIICLE